MQFADNTLYLLFYSLQQRKVSSVSLIFVVVNNFARGIVIVSAVN